MKFFKTPVVAVFLALIIILSSTVLSVNVKLNAKSRAITDGFYSGVRYEGYTHPSISTQLSNICGAADGLVTLANNYDIDTGSVTLASRELKSALSNSSIPYLYSLYLDLMNEVNTLMDQLDRTDLTERDQSGLSEYGSTIIGAQSMIESSGYNESVRTFLREQLRFPADVMADLTGVSIPELFA